MEIDQDGVPEKDEIDLSYHLGFVPEFGIWNPNIKEAAELVAVDMWFSGKIEGVNEPEDFDGDGRAPWLIAALGDTVAVFEARLLAAIENGKLEALNIGRILSLSAYCSLKR